MRNESASGAPAQLLSRALEHDHREIDGALEVCANDSASSAQARADLEQAVQELRRHIYVEEELLFPPLREAGMAGPIMVMLREHAQMWPILDTLDDELAADARDDVLRTACRQVLDLLQRHNPKEEQILYPQVDQVVGDNASIDAREFLQTGQVPADWTCHGLRGIRGPDPGAGWLVAPPRDQ